MGFCVFPKGYPAKEKKRSIFWFMFFLLVFLAHIWPLFMVGNRVAPYILGMPFSMFWIVLWTFIGFVGLLAMYKSEYGGKK